MKIGCVKELKPFENRVALIPQQVKSLMDLGAYVLIEEGAGISASFSDDLYVKNGAKIKKREEVWLEADLIVKVKEPLKEEFSSLKPGQALFTFLHLAVEPGLARELLEKQITAIAYETIFEDGELPILKPMSEVAGRMAAQVGAHCLERQNGGKGILLSGIPGVRKAKVMILGAGVVGKNAAKIALGLGAEVLVLDISQKKLEYLDDLFHGRIKTLFSNEYTLKEELIDTDLVIGAVLIPGEKAPKLINRDMIKNMEKGSVLVDVSVDQGGCIETMHKTTHDNPIYFEEGIVHYGVANMPGAVALTSTLALSHAIWPYLRQIVQKGVFKALKENKGLLLGLNTFDGTITHKGVAQSLNLPYNDPEKIMKIMA